MARDALSAGDRITAETYYQHAEHYFRVLNASTDPQPNGHGRIERRGGDVRHDGQRPAAPAERDGQVNVAPVNVAANGQDGMQPANAHEGSGRHHRPAPDTAGGTAPASLGRTANERPNEERKEPSGGCEPAGV